ncbi:MAG: hypothetical protein BGO00_13410 [Alphaproteobacteria bacterium 62-8]|nr:MAG: hypothetical protein BGO00_13410 [Alphaproteobacteria bacterium 62-8]
MRIHRAKMNGGSFAPYCGNQIFAAVDATWVLDQETQQAIFRRPKVDVTSRSNYSVRIQINMNVAEV